MAKNSSLTLKWLWLTPMTRLLTIGAYIRTELKLALSSYLCRPIQSVQIDTRPLPVGLSASCTDTKLTSPLWPTHIKILAHIETWVHIRIELTSIWRLWPLTFMWGWWPGWQLPVTVKQLHLSLPNPPDSSSYCFCCCCCCYCCSDSPLTSFPQLPLQSLQLKISCRVTFSLQQISLELAGPLTCHSTKLLGLPSIETLSWLIWPVSTSQTNCQQLLSADCLLTSFYYWPTSSSSSPATCLHCPMQVTCLQVATGHRALQRWGLGISAVLGHFWPPCIFSFQYFVHLFHFSPSPSLA